MSVFLTTANESTIISKDKCSIKKITRVLLKTNNLIKLVAQFYTVFKKYINTTLNMTLYLNEELKFACGSRHCRVCSCELL